MSWITCWSGPFRVGRAAEVPKCRAINFPQTDQSISTRVCEAKVKARFCLLGNRVGESGGLQHVPTAYCAHRSAAGFAFCETGNKQTETMGCQNIISKSWPGGSGN